MGTATQQRKRKAARIQERVAAPAQQPSPYRVLTEVVSWAGSKPTIDREKSIIPGVKVLGLQSANGRTYTEACAAKAVNDRLYENARVNLNHPVGNPQTPRDYQDRLGQLRNIRLDSTGGIIGDLHFNPKHQLAEQLLWDAENSPDSCGLSHNVQAKTRMDGNRVVVEQIYKVQGVDLVADPATTRSLYEYDSPITGSGGRMPDSNCPTDPNAPTMPMNAPPPKLKEDDEDGDAGGDPKTAIANVFNAKIQALTNDDTADPMETGAKIKKLLQAKAKALQHLDDALGDDDSDTSDDEEDDDGMEHLRPKKTKGNPVTESKELADAKAQIAKFQAKERARKLLVEAQLPPQACTELFLKQLTEADEKMQQMMIEERRLFCESTNMQRPRSRDEAFSESFDPTGGRKGPPATAKDLLESCPAIEG
jgi:hypothetical protein